MELSFNFCSKESYQVTLSDLTTGKTGTIVVVNESIQRYSFIRIYIGFFHPLFNKSYSCETTKDLKDRIDVR